MDHEISQSYDKSYSNRDYELPYPSSYEFWRCSYHLTLKILEQRAHNL